MIEKEIKVNKRERPVRRKTEENEGQRNRTRDDKRQPFEKQRERVRGTLK